MKLDAKMRRELKLQAMMLSRKNSKICLGAVLIYVIPAMLIAQMLIIDLSAPMSEIYLRIALNFILEIIILGPIALGIQFGLCAVARGDRVELSSLFEPLTSIKAIFRGVRMMACIMFRTFLFMIIPTAVYALGLWRIFSTLPEMSLDAISQASPQIILLLVVYIVLLLPAMGHVAAYVMGYDILRQDEKIGVWKATKKASKLMNGNKKGLILLVLSFWPWYLGGLVTMGILSTFGLVYLCITLYILHDKMQNNLER